MCLTHSNPSEPGCEWPAATVLGAISRWMRPTLVGDYYGLSTHTWSIVESGNRGDLLPDAVAQVNRLCFVHELIHENVMSEEPVTHILSPIRWTMAAMQEDGTRYDFWDELSGLPGLFEHASTSGFASNPVSPWLLPANGHCAFVNSEVEYQRSQMPVPEVAPGRPVFSGYETSFIDSGFQEVSPDVDVMPALPPAFYPEPTARPNAVYAVQQIINGSPAGPCFMWADATPQERTDFVFKLKVKPGDQFALDIWYQMSLRVVFTRPRGPGDPPVSGDGIIRTLLTGRKFKILHFLPVSLVATGRLFGALHFFGNVAFSTRFSIKSYRLTFSISGHVGWTLNAAGNGPVHFSQIANTTAYHPTPDNEWIESLQIFWDREIADLYLIPGPSMRARHPELSGGALLYRPRWGGDQHYRRHTTHTDFGAITHAPCGRFWQHSITAFELVSWTAGSGLNRERAVGSAVDGPILEALPRRILVKRVNR
jgi:hypothetical protein